MPDLRIQIQTVLQAFQARPLREAATRLLATLGYRSDRTQAIEDQPESMMYRIKMLLYNILDKVCIMWNDPTSIKMS
jgi:hypothetical protein